MQISNLPQLTDPPSTHPDIITFIVNSTLDDFQEELRKRLLKSKNIKNPGYRKRINDRLFAISELYRLPETPKQVTTLIISYQPKNASGVEVYTENLTRKQLSLLKTYNMPSLIDYTDTVIPIQRLQTLFSTSSLISSLELRNDMMTHTVLDSTKRRQVVPLFQAKTPSQVLDYISNTDKGAHAPYLIHGIGSLLKKITISSHPQIVSVSSKNQSPDELIQTHRDIIQQNLHIELSQFMTLLNNPAEFDKIIYGSIERDILSAVEGYRLGLLWIHESCRSRFQELIATKDLSECLNFTIKYVDTIEKGDTADTLLQNYGGAIGQAYY